MLTGVPQQQVFDAGVTRGPQTIVCGVSGAKDLLLLLYQDMTLVVPQSAIKLRGL
jgi:hypothetical protein